MKHVHAFLAEGSRFIRFLFTCTAFWLLYFLLCRGAFVFYHKSQLSGLPPSEVFGMFVHGLAIDLSTAAYLVIIPFLLWFINSLFPVPFAKKLITGYTAFMLLLVALITTADMAIYNEWGAKLNGQAIGYLKYPREAFASISSSPLFVLTGICIGLFLAGYFLYAAAFKRLSFEAPPRSVTGAASRFLLLVVFSGILFLAIRGGTGIAPMNPAFAYFSNHQFANHAALNTSWNLLYDVKHQIRDARNRYKYMPETEMMSRLARITSNSDRNDTEFILNTDRPNIIFILLESWTADVIPSLGGIGGLTPNFEHLAANGLLFTNIYSSGNRTSYSLPSVLSGFPSTPGNVIMGSPHKMEKLPVLSNDLKRIGYSTSFYYGGDDYFDNMRAYFMHGGFKKITDKRSFPKNVMDSKWGAHDHALYEKVLADLRSEREPFFVSLLTLSSHEPYEVPMDKVISGSDETSLFKNAMIYADRSLGDFFKKAAGERWFKNTLFVLVADHGHRLPVGRLGHEPEKFRIPLLLYGDVLHNRYKGARKQMIGSQTDIASTILDQLGLKHGRYEWSNNLLNRNRNNYAFYNFKDGFGWCTDGQTVGFDAVSKKLILNTNPLFSEQRTSEALKDSQAYIQNVATKYEGF